MTRHPATDSARYELVLAPTAAYLDAALMPVVDERRIRALYLEVNGVYIEDHENERADEDPAYDDDRAYAAWAASVLALLARLSARSFGLVELSFEPGRWPLRHAHWRQSDPRRCSWEAILGLANYGDVPFLWTALQREALERAEAVQLVDLIGPSGLDWWATTGWEEPFLLIQCNTLSPDDLCRLLEQATGLGVRQASEAFVSHSVRVNRQVAHGE